MFKSLSSFNNSKNNITDININKYMVNSMLDDCIKNNCQIDPILVTENSTYNNTQIDFIEIDIDNFKNNIKDVLPIMNCLFESNSTIIINNDKEINLNNICLGNNNLFIYNKLFEILSLFLKYDGNNIEWYIDSIQISFFRLFKGFWMTENMRKNFHYEVYNPIFNIQCKDSELLYAQIMLTLL